MPYSDTMKEKELMEDLLTAEKHATVNYGLFANECSTEKMRSDVMNILEDTHKLQVEIFDVMKAHGWYQTPAAEQSKIDQAKQKFSEVQCQC